MVLLYNVCISAKRNRNKEFRAFLEGERSCVTHLVRKSTAAFLEVLLDF